MKRTFKTILCAAAVVMASVSCQKSAEPVQTTEEGKGTIDIRVNGLMGEYSQVDATKAELVNTVRVSWVGGETVYVYDGTKCLGSLKASLEGDEDRYAILSTDGSTHKVSTPAQGTTTLTLVYSPLLTEAPAVSNDAISISLASQSGEKTPFVAFATLEYTGTTIKNAVVPFQFAASVIKVNCTGLKPGTAITSATLSNVNTACKLTLSGSDAPTVSGGTNGIITRTGDEYFAATKVNDEGEAVFQIAVPKLETASGARVLIVAQGSDEVKDKNFSKKAIGPATSVNTVCQLVGLPEGALKGEFSVGPNATDKVRFSKGNLYAQKTGENWIWNFYDEQYKFLAANMAVSGSSIDPQRRVNANETEIDLFTWGYNATNSVKPTGTDYVSGYDTKGNKQLNHSRGGDDWGVAYCESNSIDVDTWRTLSKDEWTYLLNTRTASTVNSTPNARYAKATVNGVRGLILLPDTYAHPEDVALTSINTETVDFSVNNYDLTNWAKMESAGAVFLPAAGDRYGSSVGYVGAYGYYWSSTAYDAGSGYAYFAYFVAFDGEYNVCTGYGGRSGGCSVRLITECQ